MMPDARGRLTRFVVLLAAVSALNFGLPRLLPGSPLAGGAIDAGILPAAAARQLRQEYRLDRPLLEQFRVYVDGLRRGDLGRSIVTHRRVGELIAGRLPWTLLLGGAAVILSAGLGCVLGTAAALRPFSPAVRAWGALTVALGALPEFLVAMALIVLFTVRFHLFPAGGGSTPFLTVAGISGALAAAGDVAMHTVLPMATLVVTMTPAFFLIARGALVPVLREPFLRTARAKGLRESRVLWHLWRNAATPVLTLTGLRMAAVVTGVAVVERVFAYPGMGMLLFDAVARRDYPVIQGTFLVGSAVVLTVNFAVEWLAGVLDPRVREQ